MSLTGIFFFICLLLIGHLSWVFAGGYAVSVNLTNFLAHRQKRGLIFNNGGAAKVNILRMPLQAVFHA